MPENNSIEQKKENIKSKQNVIVPYTDPFNKKEFYVVEGTEKNINNPNVFLIDKNDDGTPIYGTYEKPEGKNLWQLDYARQEMETLDDGTQKLYPISKNLESIYQNQNPYTNRKYLQDYNPGDVYSSPELNKKVSDKKFVYDPDKIPDKVVAYYDNSDQVKTDAGIVFKKPGYVFKKIHQDGSEEQISEVEFQKMKPINNMTFDKKIDFLQNL